MTPMPSRGESDARSDLLIRRYLTIKRRLVAEGWADEIDWQNDLDFQAIDETDFLRESAWVVLSAGMSERVIRVKFPQLTAIFADWRCGADIVAHRSTMRRQALQCFGHRGKINGILAIAWMVADMGFARVKEHIAHGRETFLETLPYVGPVTALHLAKNLGLDVAKPDRHLVRVAKLAGYDSAASLCSRIAGLVGDRVSVVDLVLWRFATQERRYRDYFTNRAPLGC